MKRVVWLLFSCLTTLVLVLTACAPKPPAEVTPKENTPQAAPPTQAAPKEVIPTKVVPEASQEKPKYGGGITIIEITDTKSFDNNFASTEWSSPHIMVYDRLLVGDRNVGPSGSRKSAFSASAFAPEGFFRMTGAIAEGWDMPDNKTIIFKVRQGVKFQNKPPVNGRELDAEDVAFSIARIYMAPKPNYNMLQAPQGLKVLSVTATDKWTVEVKVEDLADQFFPMIVGLMLNIVPREVGEQKIDLRDWRNAVGTGPFLLTDYVSNSSWRYVRNPNYWMKDELGPGKGNQLPYVDKVSSLYITDVSTQITAFRTGKVDHLSERLGLGLEDLEGIRKTNPEINYTGMFPSPDVLAILSTSKDPRAIPLLNQKVRWALSMAIDRQSMIRDYYNGDALLFASTLFPPETPYFPASPFYTSLDEKVKILERVHGMKPEDAIWVKKQYEYNPEEARKLLAEAGYPNGFSTEIILEAQNADEMSLVKEYWRQVGVDLKLDVRERATTTSITNNRLFPAMAFTTDLDIITGAERLVKYGPGDPTKDRYPMNQVNLNDPKVSAAIQSIDRVFGDYDARSKVMQEIEPYILWVNWYIRLPVPFQYTMWHPWLKNYYGETTIGFKEFFNWTRWAWVDQDLKQKMTGQK